MWSTVVAAGVVGRKRRERCERGEMRGRCGRGHGSRGGGAHAVAALRGELSLAERHFRGEVGIARWTKSG
jgi:hypothetical protein